MDDDLDDLIRRVDPDRWLSSRFIADPVLRADVVAVYAYDHELARAPKVASNPLLGEIRLTWWREVLDEAYEGRPVRRHPTAQALAGTIARHGVTREPLEAMIDARYRELDPRPMELQEIDDWARGSAGQAAAVVAVILDPESDRDAAALGGRAWALGRRQRDADQELQAAILGAHAQARRAARGLRAAAFPAVAHASLVKAYAAGREPSDLSKRWRMTLAVATGRL